MPNTQKDLILESSTSTGTGNLTTSLINGYIQFGDSTNGFGTGVTTNVFDYYISNQSANEWERGTGHCSAPGTLVRDTVIASSNSNALVSFSAGTKYISNAIPAAYQARAPFVPGGRLSLASLTPVMTTTQSAKTTIYYTYYTSDKIPIFDGNGWAWTTFSELTNDTTQSVTGKAGPAAVVASKNYDLFVWNDAGTIRLTRGGAWNSDTARSATTENDLQRVNGMYLNLNAITNGPAADRGTYVGTVRSNGSSQIDFTFGAAAAGGTAASLGVWNAYNRVDVSTTVTDSTATWTYSTATWRSTDASNTNRVTFLSGLAEDSIKVSHLSTLSLPTTGALGRSGVALDATNTADKQVSNQNNAAAANLVSGAIVHAYAPQLGWHFIQATEIGDGTNTTTFSGGANQGLTVNFRM